MCGIAGLVNFDQSYIKTIKKSLFHRGPDAQTHYYHRNLQLVHTRLSIQDIKNGDQPFIINNHVIVFNGEIYNHLELRKKLKKYHCKTQSDTETLLALFIEFGSSVFEMIDGMFAFIIYDIKSNKLILGRDRLGKKPIYFYRNDKQLFISSELNTLSSSLPDLSVNNEAIATFLRVGFFGENSTPYNFVEEVSPGHYYEVNLSSLNFTKNKYFDLVDQYLNPIDIDHNEAIIQLDSILHKSVKDRLLSSDLDVGAFLSSGIDSSLIVAIASQYRKNIKTFTVKFQGSYDESAIALETSKKFSTNHHELEISINLKNDVEKILTAYGEPFMDSSAIPSFYISQEAKKYVTVILNGDGADELFAGYRRHVPAAHNWLKYANYFSILASALPSSNKKMSYYNYLYRLLKMSSKDDLDLYLSSTNDIFEDFYRFGIRNENSKIENVIHQIQSKNLSSLSKSLILDSKFLLTNDLLKKMDIASMSNSLEARSPFLSKYILEWAPKLKDIEKIKGLQTKFILRQLALKYSLEKLSKLPKRGFEVPLKKWVEKDLKENIYDRLESQNSYSQNYLDQKVIDRLLNAKIPVSREKRAKMLWTLYTLEVWHSSFTKDKHFSNMPLGVTKESDVKKPDEKINILFLTTGLGLGGAERVVLDICKNINMNKFKVSVIGISSQNDLLNEFYKNQIHVDVLNYRKTFTKFFNSLIDILNHIKNHQIQVVHAHMFHTLIIGFLVKILNRNIKLIFTPHNSFKFMKIRRLILWLLKPFRDFDTIFSQKSSRYFYKSSAVVIPNGVDVNLYHNRSVQKKSTPFVFIIVGRLENMKNHKFLIDLVNELNDYDFKLKIVGTGILEKPLKSYVSELNLNGKIEFLGARADVPKLLSQSNCLLLPSLWEAFPIVVLEAAATNIPVIATPVGSLPSLLGNQEGYLVDLGQFKEAMIEVLTNYENAQIKSNLLYKKVSLNYNIKKITLLYESLYKKALE